MLYEQVDPFIDPPIAVGDRKDFDPGTGFGYNKGENRPRRVAAEQEKEAIEALKVAINKKKEEDEKAKETGQDPDTLAIKDEQDNVDGVIVDAITNEIIKQQSTTSLTDRFINPIKNSQADIADTFLSLFGTDTTTLTPGREQAELDASRDTTARKAEFERVKKEAKRIYDTRNIDGRMQRHPSAQPPGTALGFWDLLLPWR